MDGTRREFMRSVGLAMLSLLGARQLAGCESSAESPEPGRGRRRRRRKEHQRWKPAGTGWERVRSCWTGLLEWDAWPNYDDYTWRPTEHERHRREARHRSALDPLVAAKAVRAPIADLLQVAFNETAEHVWLRNEGMSCYRSGTLFVMARQSRERLLERLVLLDRMVREGWITDQAVALSRQAIEQEFALLDAASPVFALDRPAQGEAEELLLAKLEAVGVQATSDEREAVRLLVEVLIGRRH